MDDVLVVGSERPPRPPPSRPLIAVVGCALLAVGIVAVRHADPAPPRTPAPQPSPTAPTGVAARVWAEPEPVPAVAVGLRLLVGTARPSLVRFDTAEVRPVPYLDMRDMKGGRLVLTTLVTHAGAAWLVRSPAGEPGGVPANGDVYTLRYDESGAALVPRRVATAYGAFPALGESFVWVAEHGRAGSAPDLVTGVEHTGRVVRAPRPLPSATAVVGSLRGGLLLRAELPSPSRWQLWHPETGAMPVPLPAGAAVLSTAESTIAWFEPKECSPRRCELRLTDVRGGVPRMMPLPRDHLLARAQLSPDASLVAVVLTELDRSRTIAMTELMVLDTSTRRGQVLHDTRVEGASAVFTTWSAEHTLVVGSCADGCRFGLWRPGHGLLLARPVVPDGAVMAIVP